MAAGLLIFPGAQPSRSRQGMVISAELRWYVNEITTPATVYTDPALTIPHPFPIVSDDAGRFPLIYADSADSFSCNWSTAAPDSQSLSFDFITPSTAEDVILLDEMNAVLSDAMDLYDSIEAVDEAVLLSEGYAAQAAAAVTGIPGTNATSTTSLTIGTGSKTLTVETGKVLVPGMTVTIAYTTNALNAMSGQVTAYNPSSGALTVTVVAFSGSGTYASWVVSLSALNQTVQIFREARTSNTALGVADARKYIDITSGTFTQDTASVGSLGNGWYLDYGNSGTGVATIDPPGTDTVGGASTLSVYPGEIYRLISDGVSNFNLIPLTKGTPWRLLQTLTGTGASISATIPAGFSEVMIEYSGAAHNAAGNTTLQLNGLSITGVVISSDSVSGSVVLPAIRAAREVVIAAASIGGFLGGLIAHIGGLTTVTLAYGTGSFASGTFNVYVR